MNKLNVNILASSSAGNCIVLSDGHSHIMLDAGLPYNKIAKKVKVSDMDAVLITHEHADHSKAVPELMRRGIDVFLSKGTFDAVDPGYPTAVLCKSLVQRETRHWYILPFDVQHDVSEPLGFLIESKATGKKALYVVDSSTIDYDFNGVNTWILEANFDEASLDNSSYEEFVKNRIRGSHYSLENLLKFLQSSDLSRTDEIYLVHLSRANSNEARYIKKVQQATGIPVFTGQVYQESFLPRKPT